MKVMIVEQKEDEHGEYLEEYANMKNVNVVEIKNRVAEMYTDCGLVKVYVPVDAKIAIGEKEDAV